MTDLLARFWRALVVLSMLATGCDDRPGTTTPSGVAQAKAKPNRTAKHVPRLIAPPPRAHDGKQQHRGPAPAPISYPVRVKKGDRILTYTPNDTTDDKEQQFTNRHEDKAQVLELLKLKPGMTVADVGCGAGYFTPDLALGVGARGKVHALDIKPALIRDLKRRLQQNPSLDPHKVVHARVSALDDIGLPAASVDMAFLAHLDFYLHSPLPGPLKRFMKSCARALNKTGRLVVLQWMQVPSQYMDGKRGTAAYSKAHLLDNMTALGLRKVAEYDLRSPQKKTDRTKLFIFRHREAR